MINRIVHACAAIAMLAFPAAAEVVDFVLEDEAEICSSCHGEEGIPIEPDYPIIWGQEYFYIYTQLRDYAAGRRQHELMTDIAAEYSRDQAKALSQYFAEKEWPKVPVELLEGDAELSNQGIAAGQCSACHSKWGGDSRIPRIAGQAPAYLSRTMHDFKDNIRMNAPDLNSTMRQLDDATIEALSRYLSGL